MTENKTWWNLILNVDCVRSVDNYDDDFNIDYDEYNTRANNYYNVTK